MTSCSIHIPSSQLRIYWPRSDTQPTPSPTRRRSSSRVRQKISPRTMRSLADESCDFAAVRALRAAGYDVATVSEKSPGATDSSVIDLAYRENRVLLTEDKISAGWFTYPRQSRLAWS